ncbi:hypothetical protein NZL82_13280 [Sphingomonas sanguinis]|uniref:hypothetical protein n=1 Tax=Sphingomonas sp. LC-1 TaxID=3110957 RepID=UPI0021BB677E|nr:hypothetical protein [Sphingomonas sp. LC-1]MCT8002847.1 hypothetical protein [Sphingomonas sp. LC-1]
MRRFAFLAPMALLAPALALALAACGGKAEEADSDVAPGNFTPPGTARPTPIAGVAQVNPLTAYIGHYPNDAVDGVTFFDRTEVASALHDAVGNQQLVQRIMSRGAVTVPIFRKGEQVIAAHGCTPHDCADNNWTVEVDTKASSARVCYHDRETMGDRSQWYMGGAPVTQPGECPQE